MGRLTYVVSDLHLGAPESKAAAPLAAFLAHITSGPPCSLVINGDGFDLLALRVMPGDVGILTGLHDDDHTWGLGGRERAAITKLIVLCEREVVAVEALRAFVRAGHDIHVVAGNHDPELAFPAVADALRDALAEGAKDRVVVHPWFVWAAGHAWIEHGHQYDPYCSFDDALRPASDHTEPDINVGTAVMRYLVTGLQSGQHGQWDRGFFGHLAWALTGGNLHRAFEAYCTMIRRLLGMWALAVDPRAVLRNRADRKEALRRVSAQSGIPLGTLARVHALRRPPLVRRLGPLMRAIMLDRLVVVIAAPVLTLFGAAAGGLPGVGLAALVALILAVVVFRAAPEPTDPRPTMRAAGARVSRILGVRHVLHGHTHAPEVVGPVYNSGTWIDGEGTLIRLDGDTAALLRWRNGALAPHTPDMPSM